MGTNGWFNSLEIKQKKQNYGTASTSNSDVGGEVFKIVGYYD